MLIKTAKLVQSKDKEQRKKMVNIKKIFHFFNYLSPNTNFFSLGRPFYTFFMTALLTTYSCIPLQEEATTCGDNEVFDTATRICQAINAVASTNNRPVFLVAPTDIAANEDTGYPLQSNIIQVDEGGSPSEDGQTVTFRFSSDDQAIIPDSGITEINFNDVFSTNASTLSPQVSITPTSDKNGEVNVTVTIDDGEGQTNTSTFKVTITAVDDNPQAVGLSNVSTIENLPVTLNFAVDEGGSTDEDTQNVTLANLVSSGGPINVNNIQVLYNSVSQGNWAGIPIPFNDLTTDAASKVTSFVITPTTNTIGNSTITLTLSDGTNLGTGTFTVTTNASNSNPSFSVNPPNPTAFNENPALPINVVFVVDEGGGSDEDAQGLTFNSFSSTNTSLISAANVQVKHAGANINTANNAPFALTDAANNAGISNTEFDVTVSPHVNGTATLTFTITDSLGGIATNSVTFTVNAVDTAPSFSNITTSHTINEGASPLTISFNVDEDQGGGSDEDTQTITLSATSGNTSVVSTSNLGLSLTEVGNSADDQAALTVTLNDADVNTGATNMTVTITANDGTNSTNQEVTLDVDPVDDAELFVSGVTNISFNYGEVSPPMTLRVGEGGNASGNFEVADIVTLSLTSSNTALLSQANTTISYNGALVGDATVARAIDTNLIAARNADLVLNFNINGSLAGTTTISLTLDDNVGASTVTSSFTLTVFDVSAFHQGWSNLSAVGATYNASGKLTDPVVKLSWNDMQVYVAATLQTAGTYSWQVFRSTTQTMNYNSPLASVAAGTLTYTDTTASAGTTYYYEVRPVAPTNSLTIPTSETFNKIRVVIPPDNMALVHRWIANQEVCTAISQTIDRNNNHRCLYSGVGHTDVSGTDYFDLGADLMVDIGENGCNFSQAPNCSASGCIGINDPTTLGHTATNGLVFYDRTTATCYWANGAAWQAVNSTFVSTFGSTVDPSTLNLPPLVRINQTDSQAYCAARVPTCATAACTGSLAGPKRLLSRKEFTLSAAHDTTVFNTSVLRESLENGTNLNTTFACNSNSGSGLVYSDNAALPPPSFADTVPDTNTLSSGRKTVRSGSASTVKCKSRYSIQDLVGNVREWNSDRCNLISTSQCDGVASATGASNTDLTAFPYNFDGVAPKGPGGSTLASWALSNTTANTPNHDKFYYPLGLLAVSTSSVTGILTIGAGIATADLHSDDIDANFSEGTPAFNKGFISGGDYNDAATAGRWTLDMLNITTSDSTTGFRCGFTVP